MTKSRLSCGACWSKWWICRRWDASVGLLNSRFHGSWLCSVSVVFEYWCDFIFWSPIKSSSFWRRGKGWGSRQPDVKNGWETVGNETKNWKSWKVAKKSRKGAKVAFFEFLRCCAGKSCFDAFYIDTSGGVLYVLHSSMWLCVWMTNLWVKFHASEREPGPFIVSHPKQKFRVRLCIDYRTSKHVVLFRLVFSMFWTFCNVTDVFHRFEPSEIQFVFVSRFQTKKYQFHHKNVSKTRPINNSVRSDSDPRKTKPISAELSNKLVLFRKSQSDTKRGTHLWKLEDADRRHWKNFTKGARTRDQ